MERSIALLKDRFRSFLDILPMQRTDLKYIIACCIQYNICLLKNDMIDIPIISIINNESNITEHLIAA